MAPHQWHAPQGRPERTHPTRLKAAPRFKTPLTVHESNIDTNQTSRCTTRSVHPTPSGPCTALTTSTHAQVSPEAAPPQPPKRRQLLPRPRLSLDGSHGQRTAVVPTDRPRSATPAVPCRPNPSTHPRAARSYQSGLSTARSTRVCCIAASAKHQSRSSSTVRTSTPTNHCTIQPATPRSLST